MTIFAIIDLETTGLDPEHDHVLEIGWKITNDRFQGLTRTRSFIVDHDDWSAVFEAIKANEVVRNMHEESGLWASLHTQRSYKLSDLALRFRDDVMRATEGLDPHLLPLHLAGRSVGFDKSFLLKTPFAEFFDNDTHGFRFHHRVLDLSAVELMLGSAGIPWDKEESTKPHRAFYDVEMAQRHALALRHVIGHRPMANEVGA